LRTEDCLADSEIFPPLYQCLIGLNFKISN
jgi:hypothetical protein